MTLIHILRGPDARKDAGPAGNLWCFGCRKRSEHRWIMHYDSEPSYYDPSFSRECPTCENDCTVGFGQDTCYEMEPPDAR